MHACLPIMRVQVIRPVTKTLLEEPRAELTALHAVGLMRQGGHLEQARLLLLCLNHARVRVEFV